MRINKTFILRLLTDPDEPGALRGLIHSVASGEDQPFADGNALLILLRQMVNARPQTALPDVDTREEEEEP